jgi:hypothetical protein
VNEPTASGILRDLRRRAGVLVFTCESVAQSHRHGAQMLALVVVEPGEEARVGVGDAFGGAHSTFHSR